MLILSTLLLGSCTLTSPPDTAARPPVNQLVKLGLHVFSPADLTLSYERQLSDNRWSVSGGIGYYGSTSHNGTIFHAPDDTFIEDLFTTQDRFYSIDLQVRRYLRPRTGPLGAGIWRPTCTRFCGLPRSGTRYTLSRTTIWQTS